MKEAVEGEEEEEEGGGGSHLEMKVIQRGRFLEDGVTQNKTAFSWLGTRGKARYIWTSTEPPLGLSLRAFRLMFV